MGLLVNLRIMGVVLFAAVLALRALDLAFAGSAEARKRALLTGGGFALAAMLTYHASLPVLWTDPFGRFAELVRTLNDHPTAWFHLFRGEWLYSANGPPLDYVPVWVGITTPPATLLLAFIGAVALAWRAMRRPRAILWNGPLRFGILLVALPVATTAAIVVLESNVYHDWRQLYFLYAPLLLLAAFGLHGIMAVARGRWPRVGAYALAGGAIAVALVSMVRIHPYEDNHFTLLTDRTTPERPESRYEMDYWGQYVRPVLTGILRDHPSGAIFVSPSSSFVRIQIRALPPHERERIVVTKDFRSGERNFLELHRSQPCLAPRPAIAYAARIYATTLHCVVEPIAWLGGLRRQALATEPLARSVYDIHRDGRLLTYVRDECPPGDVAGESDGARFFLHVVPLDPGDLPPERGLDFDNLDVALRGGSARIDGNCVAAVVLPDYPIASIRTGQFTDDGILWEMEFTPDGRVAVPPPDYAAARRDALAKEPLARSLFDVYRNGRELTYVRDGCTDEEAEARFFLHVLPADEATLPEHRREHGFDNLDFTLAVRGGRIDGNCIAVVPLPAYPNRHRAHGPVRRRGRALDRGVRAPRRGVSAAATLAGTGMSVPSDITDPARAREGLDRVAWAAREMPVLARVRERFARERPLAGVRMAGCLHVTAETANLALALRDGGAELRLCASNPLSTQDDVAAALAREEGVPVFARRGEDGDAYYRHIHQALDHGPRLTMDDGADLVATIHRERRDLLAGVAGGAEETTTGVIRLRAMARAGELRYPIVAVNESATKHLFDNRFGTGQSTIDGIVRATNVLLAGKSVVVAGYGWCGRGLASRARGLGARVTVTEVDPVRALEAVMEGFAVRPMAEAARDGDVFVTVTGDCRVIGAEALAVMKDGAILANSGHFDNEIDLPALEAMSEGKRRLRDCVDEYRLGDGRRLCLLAEGRLVNLAAAEGHPASVMDMSFANQALAAEWLVAQNGQLAPEVHELPPEIDGEIARLKLRAMGVAIDALTDEQRAYLASWETGT